jgi:hypothetical protein
MATYRDSSDHPVLQDYLAIMRRHAPDKAAFDAYVHQWFYDVVVPQYLVEDAKAVATPGGGWTVEARVKNVGTGTMPVDVAAERGDRFPHGKAVRATPYADARTTVTLAAGQELAVRIPCRFKPEKLVVDPDVHVLQLERKKATVAL